MRDSGDARISRRDLLLRLTLALPFATLGACRRPPTRNPARSREAALSAREAGLVEQLAERHGVPGWQIASFDSGRASIGAGGVAHGNRPVTHGTIFQAASLGKPIFAAAALAACRRAGLDLDTSLATRIGSSVLPPIAGIEALTVRHVLSHQSGLPNWIRGAPPDRLLFPPRRGFSYSGEAYTILQRALESISDHRTLDFLRRRALEPLHMDDSDFVVPDRPGVRIARGHSPEGDELPESPAEAPLAASSLHTTARDYGRFLIAMLGKARPDDRVLAAVLPTMLEPQVEVAAGVEWGLGWGLAADGRLFFQWGDNDGYFAFALGSLDTGRALAVLTNVDRGLHFCRELAERFEIPGTLPVFEWLERSFYPP